MAVEGFSSPSMRARAHLVRGLQLVDEMERAWTRRDYWTARELANRAGAEVRAAGHDFEESWTHTNDLEVLTAEAVSAAERRPNLDDAAVVTDSSMSESELRSAYGDR